MKFFLLPCCAHNFDAKFQRRDSKLSIYEDYIEFVQDVAKNCGFETKKDKLRIPSTKRICIIGVHRTYSDDQWPQTDENIRAFIASQCTTPSSIPKQGRDVKEDSPKVIDGAGAWAGNFQARPAVQAVRNCTTLNADLKVALVRKVVDTLLENSSETQLISLENGKQRFWRRGGCLELPEIAAAIPGELLQKLKSEFGGLQTLLRNHYHIFEVASGKVTLRNYSINTPFPKKRKGGKRPPPNQGPPSTTKQQRSCWFYGNHPDGCPLSDQDCYFIHRENTKIS